MDTLSQISKAHFVATHAQVIALAGLVVTGSNADGTYLRVLLAHSQAKLGKPGRGRRTNAQSQLEVVEAVHADLYPCVRKGVADEGTDEAEITRRATFARSACSTVRAFVTGGGDIRTVDVATVSKGALRAAIAPTEAPGGQTRAQRAFNRATALVERTVQRLARANPAEARARLEAALARFDELLGQLDQMEPPGLPAPRRRPRAAATAPDFGGTTTVVAGQHPIRQRPRQPANAQH